MSLEKTKKLSKHICRLLKVLEIQFPIGRTNKGNLTLKFSAISDDYEIMLDSVPLTTKDILNDENNINLKKMIEKYWFDEEEQQDEYSGGPTAEVPTIISSINRIDSETQQVTPNQEAVNPPKKRGRPKKVV